MLIHLENVSKTFKVAERGSTFKDVLLSFIHRRYKEVHALKNVSFKIKEEKLFGYIGPNGAGKSTTIKIMCGILTPSSR